MQNPPLLLHVEFKVDLEYAKREYITVLKSLGQWARPCMHGKRSVAFVIVTREIVPQLMERLGPVLDPVTADYRIHDAPRTVFARHGNIDTLVTRVSQAWDEIRERRNSQHMRKGKFFRTERSVNHREGGTVSQMTVEPGRVWQHPEDADRK
jgi:hypothetical protein